MPEATLGEVFAVVKSNNDKIQAVNEKVDKVGKTVDLTLTGLYGPIDDRTKGVIPQHDKRIQTLENNDKSRGWLVKTIAGTILTFILGGILIALKGNMF